MRTYSKIREKGYNQGKREALGGAMCACPYRQWPHSALRKYKAWVDGWAEGRKVWKCTHRVRF